MSKVKNTVISTSLNDFMRIHCFPGYRLNKDISADLVFAVMMPDLCHIQPQKGARENAVLPTFSLEIKVLSQVGLSLFPRLAKISSRLLVINLYVMEGIKINLFAS